jgi:hypothetical protein
MIYGDGLGTARAQDQTPCLGALAFSTNLEVVYIDLDALGTIRPRRGIDPQAGRGEGQSAKYISRLVTPEGG